MNTLIACLLRILVALRSPFPWMTARIRSRRLGMSALEGLTFVVGDVSNEGDVARTWVKRGSGERLSAAGDLADSGTV